MPSGQWIEVFFSTELLSCNGARVLLSDEDKKSQQTKKPPAPQQQQNTIQDPISSTNLANKVRDNW